VALVVFFPGGFSSSEVLTVILVVSSFLRKQEFIRLAVNAN
jgi:hypothetical protein